MVEALSMFPDDDDDDDLESVIENKPGPSHHKAPETSRQAALQNAPRSGTQRARVLKALISGRTDEDVAAWLSMGLNSVRPRRNELIEGAFVEDSGKRRLTLSGAQAVVWIATDKGLSAIRGMTDAS